MSLTSSDRRPRSAAHFRRAFIGLVAALAILCATFVALGYAQGPKLSSAQVDTSAVTEQAGQQLRLFANQPLAAVDISQITVTPDASVSVSTTGDVVAVQFDELLRYDTDYTVRIDSVTGASPSGSSVLEYSFTTAVPALHYVQSTDSGTQIISTTLGGDERVVAYAAPGIRDFAVVGKALAVLRDGDDDSSTLELVSLVDGLAETIALPADGRVSTIEASTVGTSIGVGISREGELGQELYTASLEAGRTFTQVVDLAGNPLHVLDWQFLPGTTSFVALSTASSLFVGDSVASTSLTPLGQLRELGGVSRDGLTVTGRDTLGQVAVSLADGSQQRIAVREFDGNPSFIGEAEVLPNGEVVERVAVSDGKGNFRIVLAIDDGSVSRVVYDRNDTLMDSFAISPNAQYAAVEIDATQTVIVDLGSGAVAQTLPGTSLQW